jgi:transposase
MAGFVPVELATSPPSVNAVEPARIEIWNRGGLTVSVNSLVDRAALKLVLDVVGELGL